MEFTLKNANEKIKNGKIDNKYRLKYHMMPPVGWMNDPNGLIKFNDEYHLFYQFYPYEAKWGPMHWGHFISTDLIKYYDAPVALAPTDQTVESGCFSGGAIACNDKLNLVYTRHYETSNYKLETQYVASSVDGIEFIKEDKSLFDNDTLPENISKLDFRDPNPIYINGNYYILIGGKLIDENKGIIIVLKSNELSNFKYDFHIGPFYELGDMGECPSYKNIDGVDVILASGCNVKAVDNNYKNVNSSIYIAGHIDFENKKMDVIKIDEIDKGDTFYAPQIISNNDTPIMVGWMEMWGKEIPTSVLGHNWAGAFTVPRTLSFKNDTLYQYPIDSIKNYYKKSYEYSNEIISKISDIYVTLKPNQKIIFKGNNGSFEIEHNGYIALNTNNANTMSNCDRRSNNDYNDVKLRILLDTSSVELFIDEGKESITSRIYLDSDYTLELIGDIKSLIVNEIEV